MQQTLNSSRSGQEASLDHSCEPSCAGVSAASDAALPLCVDLDGTLIRSDVLIEGLLALGMSPRLARALATLPNGRAALKQHVASKTDLDPALLPYNEALVDYLRTEKSAGRRIILVTAADRRIAESVSQHLGIFDHVLSSDGRTNLKGQAKAHALVTQFGQGGFVYAGDSGADLDVWAVAGGAILVGVSARVRAAATKLGVPIERDFPGRKAPLLALGRAIRPHQWVKNLLVFVPVLTANALRDPAVWLHTSIAFSAFCFTASAIYLVNDLADLTADRQHPRKRRRPFASGAVSLSLGAGCAAAMLLAGLGLGVASGVLGIVILYAITSVAYSVKLKEVALLDVFVLAVLYTLRLFAGGSAAGHQVSLWLLAFSSFFFLDLAMMKRVEELLGLAQRAGAVATRRGYTPGDVAVLQVFGCGAAFAATVVLALFVQSETVASRYASPALLWTIVPLMLFWQCRMWLSTMRGDMHDDPIVFAARDRVSWIVAALCGGALLLARSSLGR